ncbi:MAG: hypothetical protein QXP02_03085 [Desulfurococcaceae archaeon]
MANRIFSIESFIYKVQYENYTPREEEIKTIGELLGQPTKKLDVVVERYNQVFGKSIEKKCVSEGDVSICIYSWSPKVPFKVFPASLHAFGTIILFEKEMPKHILAYPINKALSYAKSPGLPENEYGDLIPVEVSERIDGWQLTAYFNPLLGRWIFATRYALHNMYYKKGKLIVEQLDQIVNPYVAIGDVLAEKEGLYEKLDKYRGWTFTFILEGVEPAITKPPYPIGAEYDKYRLYALMARDTEGKLYTWSETARLLQYRVPPLRGIKPLRDIHVEVKTRLDIRSYFAFVKTGDPENPLLVELESDHYPDAMNVKYLYDAKSSALLITDGLGEELKKILDQSTREAVTKLEVYVKRLEDMFSNIKDDAIYTMSHVISKALRDLVKTASISPEEVSRYLKERNTRRLLRKVLSMLLNNRSLMSDETFHILDALIEKLRGGETLVHNTSLK